MIWRNPLLQKEFRQRMRTKRAPAVISGYLGSMVVLTLFLLYENGQGQWLSFQPVHSEQVFFVLSLLQTALAAFLTPAFAAGSISGERERRTLSVLLTTPLSPLGILLGKIASSSALLGLLLFSTLPLYSLVFLFGGAVPQEVLSVFAFQLFNIVLIAALSVMWSSITLRSGWSTVISYGTVGFMVLVTGIVGYGLRLLAGNPVDWFAGRWSNILLNLNPLWIEASLENQVTASQHAWVMYVVFYSVVILSLLVPALFRLRPGSVKLVPRKWRADERAYQ